VPFREDWGDDGKCGCWSVERGASGTTGPFARMSVRNFLAIAALHEASTLAVSLPLAVVNGPRCKLARSYGVLSLIYLPTEANIPILEAGRISK
jgi:hypothetical protein